MGKANNLGDFMTDLADAIREKTGESSPINPQEFSQKIKDLKTGGASESKPRNDVTFIDYDGIILHSFSKEEFLALNAFPALPKLAKMICEGWNWTFEGAKQYVAEYGRLIVGATYITDDGKTRLYIHIPDKSKCLVELRFGQSVAYGVAVNWGDGIQVEREIFGGTIPKAIHTYAQEGDYCITLEPIGDCLLSLGYGASGTGVLGTLSTSYDGRSKAAVLRKVQIGKNSSRIQTSAFSYSAGLETITIPQAVTQIGTSAFYYAHSLKAVVFPKDAYFISQNTCSDCPSLKRVSLGENMTSFGDNYSFQNCYSLEGVTIPPQVTSLNSSAFYGCSLLTSATIPNGVTAIASKEFYNCYCLVNLTLPSSITSIEANAFYVCSGLEVLDCSSMEAIPSLANTNAFTNANGAMRIIVPDSLYDGWIAATNWSSHASKIIKKTDWDASQA